MKEGQAEAYYSYFKGRYRDWPSLSIHYNTIINTLRSEEVPLTLQNIDDALLDLLDILQVPCVPREGDARLYLIDRTVVKSFYNVIQDFPFLLQIIERRDFTWVAFAFAFAFDKGNGNDNGEEKQTLIQLFKDDEVKKEEYNGE